MRVRNNMVSTGNNVVYCLVVLNKPPPLALMFTHCSKCHRASKRDNGVLRFVIFYYGRYALRGFIIYRVLINTRKRF